MAKYNFSTVGATELDNYYGVRFFQYDAQLNEHNIKEYVLATPLNEEEVRLFVKARVDSLKSLCFHITLWSLKRDKIDMSLRHIGLSGLAFLLSGKGITPETIDIKFNGKVYNVDVDKYAKFLESMQ